MVSVHPESARMQRFQRLESFLCSTHCLWANCWGANCPTAVNPIEAEDVRQGQKRQKILTYFISRSRSRLRAIAIVPPNLEYNQ
jgi:hypothetical protein